MAAAGDVRLSQLQVSQGHLYWAETRPGEGGRVAVRRLSPGQAVAEAIPAHFNCRSRVHEYGGGAFLADGLTLFCSSYADQRLYRIDPAAEPTPITPEPASQAGLRYADARLTPDGQALVCVRERHSPGAEAVNELVAISPRGEGETRVLAAGRDFYASPRISPDGLRLAWLCWDHPQMPWDGCELWMAEWSDQGELSSPRRVVGDARTSIFQPEWDAHGVLHFVSEQSGWWNLYRWEDAGVRPLAPMEAEFGSPQWVFGLSRYAFLPDGRIACIASRGAVDQLGLIEPGRPHWRLIETEYSCFQPPHLQYDPVSDRLLMIGSNHRKPPGVIALDPDSGAQQLLHPSRHLPVNPGMLSEPQEIEYPTHAGLTAHALFYPPTHEVNRGPEGELPPCIVMSHGGPTGRAVPQLDLETQFWTSRGFAVVDVNYGGSTGYGRAYRQRLQGQWGIVDVQDCLDAAQQLADAGRVDGGRLIIRGGSAGGYTTLCALVFHTDFATGASYYGVADVEMLARDTHKFEARYLDGLIGPYPQAAELYRQRSPVHSADRISCPIILFQGLEDPVVPPSQAEALLAALRSKGLPHAYLAIEGEAHGFRDARNISRCLEAELFFYSRVLGFELADAVEPIEISNL